VKVAAVASRAERPSWKRVALGVLVGCVLMFLIIPIAIIIPLSFGSAQYLQFPPPGFSLQWYHRFFGRPEWMASLWLSVRVAVMSTVMTVALGLGASIALVRGRFPGKTVVYAIILSPMIVPTIITAIAVYFFFARLHMIGSPLAMALGHTVVALPLVVIIVSATLQGLDPRLEQAAASLGASPARAFLAVTLPLVSPGIVSGALFAFLTSFDELLIPLFLSGPTTMTLPVRIWTDVIMQIDPIITAVSSFLIGVALLILGLAAVSRGRRGGVAPGAEG
jgi:putative spermidine/putrescine transport system permease protein